MLPDPQHRPSYIHQPAIGVTISTAIGFYLLLPETSIVFRPAGMLRAAMPETPINEDGQLLPREGDVGTPTWPLQDPIVHSILQASTMNRLAYGKLRRSVLPADLPHSPARFRGRGLRILRAIHVDRRRRPASHVRSNDRVCCEPPPYQARRGRRCR